MSKSFVMVLVAGVTACMAFGSVNAGAVPVWTSPNHYRLLVTVNPLGVTRTNSPAMMKNLDFKAALASVGSTGHFDENTLEVIAYDSSGQPRVFDASRSGYEKYLLPCRLDPYFGMSKCDVAFAMPNQTYTQYEVYFDTVESGLGKPQRYQGIVGDGDWFREGYKRREATAGHMEDFCDFDQDGDQDLFRVTVESLIYCYENVGGNKLVYRGLMSSGGSRFVLDGAANNRSWPLLEFNDWDGDGDTDLFVSYTVGPDGGHVVRYENITTPGGNLTFRRVTDANNGRLLTVGGQALSNGWFGAISIVDYDGDGKKDVLAAPNDILTFYKNIGPTNSMTNIQLANGVPIQAGGVNLAGSCIRGECADFDHDGDLDMFATGWTGDVYYYKNTGTRTNPVYAAGQKVAASSGAQVAVTPSDWDGDGEIELAVGQYWNMGEQFGLLWKNVGTLDNPQFESRDAYHGCPYTEQFQPCSIGRQNGVRACDWDNDGDLDLISGDQWGDVYLHRNTTNQLFPIYAAPEHIMANGAPINTGSYSRTEICDYDRDGKKDLLIGDDYAQVWYYRNIGTDAVPVLAARQQLYYQLSGGGTAPINGGGTGGGVHGSVMICNWDNDTKRDLIDADSSKFYYYKNIGTDSAPVYTTPQILTTSDGVQISYVRPNLGSYVDWDLDGRPDFLACAFEDCVYYYRNKGWNTDGTPKLAAPVTLIQPWCTTQMIQGVDAKDYNGDGDVDIITGQGHGGNGFRFWERNYVNDYVNNTFPTATAASAERGLDVSEAKAKANGQAVAVPQGVITGVFGDYFYIESLDRENGIKVYKPSHGRSVGQAADVYGTMATDSNGERYISASTVLANGTGSVAEFVLTSVSAGGADLAGQRGVTDGLGANNIGLLVRAIGKCALNLANPDTGGDYYGARYLFIDDGSGALSWYRAQDGSYAQVTGVKVEATDATITAGDPVTARGISSIELVNGVYQRRLLTRPGLGDVVKML